MPFTIQVFSQVFWADVKSQKKGGPAIFIMLAVGFIPIVSNLRESSFPVIGVTAAVAAGIFAGLAICWFMYRTEYVIATPTYLIVGGKLWCISTLRKISRDEIIEVLNPEAGPLVVVTKRGRRRFAKGVHPLTRAKIFATLQPFLVQPLSSAAK